MTYNEACKAIYDNRHDKALSWAVGYAIEGMKYANNSDAAICQSLYILNNISGWRGDVAKEVRATLKATVAKGR
jgi:hypothetical protein